MIAGLAALSTDAAPVRYAGSHAELTVARVSDRTVELRLAPLDANGQPLTALPSSVLVSFPREVVWRGRELSTPKEVMVAGWRIRLEPSPLTLQVRRADGRIVQRLVWNEADGFMSFRTDAPVLGLGEGGPQFDRRGRRYPMKDGWGADNRPVLGSRIAVPFLIGTDGWALFLHQPQGPGG